MSELPTPFTVLGGFLGAGKTTLLNRILTESSGTRYAVLVNDFGKINIDANLIKQHEGQTLTLSNGCICCSLADGFITTMLSLMQRRDEFDHIVVEASGVSEPQKIMDIARLDPELSADAIVVLVDLCNFPRQLDDPTLTSVVRSQIQCADLLLMNKIDLVDGVQSGEVQSCVQAINTRAPTIECAHARVPIEVITGVESAACHAPFTLDQHHFTTNADASNIPITNSGLYSSSYELKSMSQDDFRQFCLSLPASVIRGKGLVRFAGQHAWWRWHKVADNQSLEPHTGDDRDSHDANTIVPREIQSEYGSLVLISTENAPRNPAWSSFFTVVTEASTP